ncbi:divalent-cation tolerance protein CutA [uncultured Ralstonia sp.]|jgi:periplasmic divalent cation tolerance protein|uniref:divalent-cation tolerance protein CutA n=1 Tax=Ralstonia sp. TaxID=54061 RepID=UPI001EABBC89|nr:divalent-cation tolerance protein CutA [uncultured Ralstonia sp.]UCF26405.1 MAG: divalent-cation tolerance protein CutA [Ralstonia sp.]
MSPETDVLLVLTNLPDGDSVDRVTKVVLESRTAACVNQMPACVSSYWWNGVIEHATEIPLLIKTTRAAYPALEAALRKAHPYEVPEIIAVPVEAGLPAYLAWVVAETRPRSV